MNPARVPWPKRIAYGLPAFALAVVGIPVYVYIPKFYTDSVGIDVAVVGVILLAVRLFDAVTDPLVGWLSDHTQTRFGRRRPYIAVGGIGVALSMYFLFTPPPDGSSHHTLWLGVCIFILFLFWTLVTVPYEALGPEITFDYTERSALFAVRDGLLILGTLTAASFPVLVAAVLGTEPTPAGERRKFFWTAVLYAPILLAACGWCVHRIKELPSVSKSPGAAAFGGLGAVLENRPFLILLSAYTISAIGSNLPATLILYYVDYVLESPRAELYLVLYLVMGVLFLPAWIAVSRRIGKKHAWIAAMIVNTGAFMGVFFLGPGDEILYGMLVIVSGIGFGASLALPSAIQADVIDYDELLTGQRREGCYIGIWSIAKKLAAAVGVGAGLTLLGDAGYTPNAPQPPDVLMTLRVMYALVPCLCNVAAIVLILKYPLDAGIHGAILSAIESRRTGSPVADPLRPGRQIAA
jgi:GPH family glycoside/pentoside/hexuronide:cation symporter